MFKNRFSLIATVLFVLTVSLAVSSPFSNAPKPMDSATRSYIAWGQALDAKRSAAELSDYYQRHPELRGGIESSIQPALQNSIIDECFDVSVSELTACREASQSASQ